MREFAGGLLDLLKPRRLGWAVEAPSVAGHRQDPVPPTYRATAFDAHTCPKLVTAIEVARAIAFNAEVLMCPAVRRTVRLSAPRTATNRRDTAFVHVARRGVTQPWPLTTRFSARTEDENIAFRGLSIQAIPLRS